MSKHERFDIGKIGGSNMSQIDEVTTLVGESLVRSEGGNALTVSAFSGVTDALLKAVDDVITSRNRDPETLTKAFEPVTNLLVEQIEQNPLTGARQSFSRSKTEAAAMALLDQAKQAITDFESSNLRASNTKALLTRDRVIEIGERTGGLVLASHLQAHDIPAQFIDEVEATDFSRGLHEGIQLAFVEKIKNLDPQTLNQVLIFGGHVRGLPGGIANAIGRSYSDTSAVDLAKAFEIAGYKVPEVTFWKDVEALLTADPRFLNLEKSEPLKVPDISLREALEAARSGSSLIHVQALELADQFGINLRLKKLQQPDSEGTRYSNNEIITGRPFKTLVRHPHDALTLDITRVAGQAGVIRHFSKIFADHNISVNDIATEGNSATFTIPLPRDESDREALRSRIRDIQSSLQSIAIGEDRYDIGCEWRQDSLENIAVVGTELENRPGILGLLSSCLSAHSINIMTAVHSMQQSRISFYVSKNDAERAYKVLHMCFIDRAEKVIDRTNKEFARLLESVARW